MIRTSNQLVCAVTGLALLATIASADIITKWTFDSSSNTPPYLGSGAASYVGGTVLSGWVVGYPSSGIAWSTKTYPTQSTATKTAGVRFDVNTTGFSNIMVSFVWQASNTGSSNGVFQFSTDGFSSWTEWPTLSSGPGVSSWKTLTFDLSTNFATANCAGFCFRFVSAFAAGTSSYAPAGTGTYGPGGTWKFDEVAISGTPLASLNLTSTNATVSNDTTTYLFQGVQANVTGDIIWSNTLNAATGTATVNGSAWSATVPLDVGNNVLVVSAAGVSSKSVTVTRLAPFISITNPSATFWAVDADTSNFTLAGTAGALSGNIQWTNALTGATGTVAGASAWSIAGLALAPGTNIIAVSGNGGALSASVQLVRLPPAAYLKRGDLALVGWDDTQNSNRFSFLTLAAIPVGSVVYFTDNGWSNTQFRGASANGGDGNETLLKFLAVQTIPAGTLVRLVDANPAVEWIRGDTIPGGGTTKFKDLVLSVSGGDQICAFQAPAANPLWAPAVHLFVLDDSGAFEDALDPCTGNVPPGLIAGKTALTFAQSGTSQHVMTFTNFDGQARNKGQWLAAIANSNNWFFGSAGDLPTNAVSVAPPPLLTLQTVPANAGTVSGAGRYDADDTVTLTATPLPGWTFVRWSDGNTNTARTLTMSTSDVLVTAFFTWRSTLFLLQ